MSSWMVPRTSMSTPHCSASGAMRVAILALVVKCWLNCGGYSWCTRGLVVVECSCWLDLVGLLGDCFFSWFTRGQLVVECSVALV